MLKNSIVILCLNMLIFSVSAQQNFVKTKGSQFTIAGKPYYYIGTNYWYGGLLQAVKGEQGRARLKQELDFLKAKGVTNLRVLAGSEGLGQENGVQRVNPPLQPQQGVFKPEILESLDYLLNEMHKRNMYAVLFLSNNWEWSGGFLQYLNWNGKLTDTTMRKKLNWDEQRNETSKFYTCESCMMDYNKQVKLIVSHINKYNNIKYANDPTIMAWELANEPRPMRSDAVAAYKQWILNAATFIKGLDKNHLITIGTEGTQGTEGSAELFQAIHAFKPIDYLTIHIWPKNWGWFRDSSIVASLPQVISKSVAYIQQHEAIAKAINKPLVLEEFGLPRDAQSFDPKSTTNSRDKYYEAIFNEWKRSAANGGAIAGCNFWAFGGTARPIPGQIFWKEGDDFMGDPPQEEQGLNAVFTTDNATWKIIQNFTNQK
ncbi:glycoside hydrolase 5 family protein [Mucilaginibacter arboris]|uniref:mannan endo-1,4-beta-mannosidase n=1 Tax=Mucilaginibacter arboris TaxID=2682090 RepID=A0A7K1SZL7_9SPHI|nr:cellulase family glycosylhydrolase [Mucilaginibacter arboris]MVN22743.1 cellulase family glycosylhydrolase [Mucilaginibacter arboris]